jgi:hypothetical protein
MELSIVKNLFSFVFSHFCSQMSGYGGPQGTVVSIKKVQIGGKLLKVKNGKTLLIIVLLSH